jgi:hypothetical protein
MHDCNRDFGFAETLSTMEAAAILHVTPEALHARVRAGTLVPINRDATTGTGRGYRFRLQDVRAIFHAKVLQGQRRAQRAAAKARVANAARRLQAARADLKAARVVGDAEVGR